MIDPFSAEPAGEVGAPTVRAALRSGERRLEASGVESARLDAELLLGSVLGGGRERLYRDLDRRLGAAAERRFRELVLRRCRREPLAYIVGKKEFWSLDFVVAPEVLVPRPETELLVETALNLVDQRHKGGAMRVLDLGTGSGAIAVSLAKERGDVEIWATDLCPRVLQIARLNASVHGVLPKIEFFAGDRFEPIHSLKRAFHLLVSNPPYLSRSEMKDLPAEVREWEPRLALYGGMDGLDFYRHIVREAPRYLARGGFVALEIGAGMATAVSALIAAAGCYAAPAVHQDLAGRDRVVTAQLRFLSRASRWTAS